MAKFKSFISSDSLLHLSISWISFEKTLEQATMNVHANELFNSIKSKIICGYQGWFNAGGDGAPVRWKIYQNNGKFEPGTCSPDFRPDASELKWDVLFMTSFRQSGGIQAFVFSSTHPKTVDHHLKWMKN